jgi:hypothetical protein
MEEGMQSQLKSLSERLLRAGVAHQHVRRYIRELHEHYEDTVREELAKGLDRSRAERAAWARLGSEEELAQSVLAQPALCSTAARFPVLVFGGAPILFWLASLALSVFVPLMIDPYLPKPAPNWFLGLIGALFLLDVRVLPVMLGIVLLMVSARQRIKLLWPIIGAAIVAVLGGTTNVHLTLAAIPDASSVGIDTALLPMFFRHSKVLGKPDVLALAGGLVRAALMLAVAAMLSVTWRNRQDRSSNASIC